MAFSVVRCPECGFQINEESSPAKTGRQTRAFDDRHGGNTAVTPHRATAVDSHPSRLDDPNWVILARFQNAAMAGYFADELHRQFGFATEVDLQEEREPIHSTWSIRFCLLVEKSTARQAAYALQLIARDESEPDPTASKATHPVVSMEPRKVESHIGRLTWVMSILALVAVLFVIMILSLNPRGPWQRGRPGGPGWQRAMAAQQFAAINAEGTPWTQPINNGAGTRRLALDAARQVSVIETDADGDGLFESSAEFPWPAFDPIRFGAPRPPDPLGAAAFPAHGAIPDGQPMRNGFQRPPIHDGSPRPDAASAEAPGANAPATTGPNGDPRTVDPNNQNDSSKEKRPVSDR